MKYNWIILIITSLIIIISSQLNAQIVYSNSFESTKNTYNRTGHLYFSNREKSSNYWIIRNSNTSEKLNDVVMLNDSTAIAVGDEGSILKSTNSGLTWINTAPPVYCNNAYCVLKWNSISFYDSLNGIVAGNEVLMTTDGGEQWQFKSVSENKTFLCANYMETNYIYLGDDSGNVYLSIDTGKTWTSEKLTSEPIKSIFYYAAPYMSWRPVYVLTSRSVYSTKTSSFDGWKEEQLPITTWSSANKGNNFKWGDPSFIVGYDGQFAVTPLILRKTYTDSSWQKYSFPSMPAGIFNALNDVSIPSQNIAYACGDNGFVIKTSDKGETWLPQQTGIKNHLNAIDFFNKTNGIAVGDSGVIIFTSENISNKNSAPLPFHLISPVNEDTILFLPKSILFTWQEAVDSNSDVVNYTLLLSADTCKTWLSLGDVTETALKLDWPGIIPSSPKYFWTVIANDGMLATTSLEVFAFSIVNIAGINNRKEIPAKFILHQNYPNPFNPLTTIGYELPVEGRVEIKIYDITGRDVAVLLNEYKSAGIYQVKWNALDFPSGIYFYSIRFNSESRKALNYYSTRKLVLIK